MSDDSEHWPQLTGQTGSLNRVDCGGCGEHLGLVPTSAGMAPVLLLLNEHRAEQDD